eukprot:Clim_evm4s64 gene=Clim_evmTU4s64
MQVVMMSNNTPIIGKRAAPEEKQQETLQNKKIRTSGTDFDVESDRKSSVDEANMPLTCPLAWADRSTSENICSLAYSDIEPRTVSSMLNIEGLTCEEMGGVMMSESPHPFGCTDLRAAIVKMLEESSGVSGVLTPDNVVVFNSVNEAVNMVTRTLAKPKEHIIVQTPCFPAALELYRSRGCHVHMWRSRGGLEPEPEWHLGDLKAMVSWIHSQGGKVSQLVLSQPNNPTGHVMARTTIEAIMKYCAEEDMLVIADETYRLMEHSSEKTLPALSCMSAPNPKMPGVSIGSVSKALGLAGLNIGWIVCQSKSMLMRVARLKCIATSSPARPSELVATIALNHWEQIVKENHAMMMDNWDFLVRFVSINGHRMRLVRSSAGPVAFVRLIEIVGGDAKPSDANAFCRMIKDRFNIDLLSGAVYGKDNATFLRIGYGRKDFKQCIGRLQGAIDVLDSEEKTATREYNLQQNFPMVAPDGTTIMQSNGS